jgi:exodeoxyribonuclease V gamma subunit
MAEILGTRDADPWAPESLMWPLLRVIDEVVDEPWARVLAEHLGHGVAGDEGELRRGRRLAVSRRLAGLFASYAVQRPALLADWEAGGAGDGGGGELPADLAWQPELWRRLVDHVGVPSPVRRQETVVEHLRSGADDLDLPERVSLFGHTRLTAGEAELLAALGVRRDVHLWLPHPSDELWQQVRGAPPSGWRRDDHSHVQVTHPLLAAMARDVREVEAILLGSGATDDDVRRVADRPATLLGRLQGDLAANTTPAERATPDGTIQVHACHGPARQVEVLREVVLGLLADDETL